MLARTTVRQASRLVSSSAAARTAASANGAKLAASSARSCSILSLSRSSAAASSLRASAVLPAVRAAAARFHASSRASEKDRSWVDKGVVTYAELKPETQAPSGNITIIDVREPDEVAQGIIPSAVNVPLSKFQTAFAGTGTGGNFVRDFGFDRPQFDDALIFYCRSGKRSQEALDYARAQGWWNSRNYTGSWLDWTANEEKK
ncbi:hypothetical protein OC834_002278 [Tilletia horrida]|uniref:Rhodanese domain-containing protein n=1 Tax=Tilletia horrida TaxID=155126 RepID=A0AAN6JSL4_9BASI|nr:hypothetical protein OC835_003162 [Tilletia horrida]KAK0533380.1 hypothetical protein OC834_002278 [Tilletia horrida]KAK0536353.1 hypothetical protein OC842_002028 [Tilletia horrida]KAK0563925.1 hypothetical protein OC844_001974 [Tilletia horrida]